MTIAIRAVTAEPWAITPDWLHVIAALAMRQRDAPVVQTARENAARDDNPRHMIETFFAGPQPRRLENGSGRATVVDAVALIPVTGPIFPRANMMTEYSGATSVVGLQRDLRAALDDEAVNAVMLVIDSPGGAVSGVNAFADALFAARNVKPMGAHIAGTGASAAYWIASATERVTIERTGIAGSIGVVTAMPKQKEPDTNGEMWIEIVSANAPNKRPDPESEDGLKEIRSTLDAIEQQFIADVARGRTVTTAHVAAEFGKGGVVVGPAAVKRGMADKVDSLEGAVQHMARVGKVASKSK